MINQAEGKVQRDQKDQYLLKEENPDHQEGDHVPRGIEVKGGETDPRLGIEEDMDVTPVEVDLLKDQDQADRQEDQDRIDHPEDRDQEVIINIVQQGNLV